MSGHQITSTTPQLLIPESWDVLRTAWSDPVRSAGVTNFIERVRHNLLRAVPPDDDAISVPEGQRIAGSLLNLIDAPCDAIVLHRLTGHPLDLDNIIRLLEGLYARKHWMLPSHARIYREADDPRVHDCTADLYTARITIGIALVLDWGENLLPPHLAARLRQALRTRGTDRILDNIRRNVYWADWYISNWCLCLMTGLAVGTSCDTDDPLAEEKLREAADRTRRFLDAQGNDGGYHEGMSYAATLQDIIFTALALERAGRTPFWDHPFIARLGDFLLHGITPGFTGVANFSDATYHLRPMPVLAFLARRYAQPEWQWAAAQLANHTPVQTRWDLLWPAHDMPGQPPADAQRIRLFTNTHTAFVRSHWGENARYLVITAGSNAFGHRHADLGGFILEEFGERQIADAGTHEYYTSAPWHVQPHAHNVLTINGQAPLWKWGQHERLNRIDPANFGTQYALIEALGSKGDTDVVVVDLTHAYQEWCTSYVRALISLHDGPLLVLDDLHLQPACAAATLEVRFIATGDVKLGGSTFSVVNRHSICHGEVLWPRHVSLTLDAPHDEIVYEPVSPARLTPIRVCHRLPGGDRSACLLTLLWPTRKNQPASYRSTIAIDDDALCCSLAWSNGQCAIRWERDTHKITTKR
jgi:hypothetical protein